MFAEFDRCDIKVYEEVERSKTHRCTLILVGAQGVGKRSLKERLIRDNPRKYAAATPRMFEMYSVKFNCANVFQTFDVTLTMPCMFQTYNLNLRYNMNAANV